MALKGLFEFGYRRRDSYLERRVFFGSGKLSLFAFGNKNRLTEMGEKTRFSHFRVDQPFQDLENKVMD